MSGNPFGEDPARPPRRVNPFGDEPEDVDMETTISRIEHAGRTIRRLKGQLGAEGLTLSATRELIDEMSHALDAAARALRHLTRRD